MTKGKWVGIGLLIAALLVIAFMARSSDVSSPEPVDAQPVSMSADVAVRHLT